jgi:hypothetical protein
VNSAEGFDPREVRLRVQTAFSAGEMRGLLERWGLGTDGLSDDRTALANAVVKRGSQSLGVSELLRRLKSERPLLEWPEPAGEDAQWAGPMSGAVSQREPEAPLPELSLLTPIAPDAHGRPTPTVAMDAAQIAETVVVDVPSSHADAPPPSMRTAPSSMRFGDAGAPPPPSDSLFSSGGNDRAPAKQGIDPRIFIGVIGGMVVLAGIAFAAGFVFRRPTSGAASSSGPKIAAAPRSTGVAGRAANAFDKSLLQVATLCDLDVSGAPTREIFSISQEGCGTVEQERIRRREQQLLEKERKEHGLPPLPTNEPDDDPTPTARAPRDLGRPQTDPGGSGGAPKGGCLANCNRVASECSNECGPEPNDSSLYGKYQQCTGRCLGDESRCRLNCK